MSELPCPFCGHNSQSVVDNPRPSPNMMVRIDCNGCMAEIHGRNAEEVRKAWNTRHAAPVVISEESVSAALDALANNYDKPATVAMRAALTAALNMPLPLPPKDKT